MTMSRGKRRPGPELQRFLAFIDKQPNGCWLWTGYQTKGGYGQFRRADQSRCSAHVWAYEHWVGPVPDDKQLDHYICDNPPCANPHHVRPATARENVLRSGGPAARNARKTHCNHGHPLSGSNLNVATNGKRECIACKQRRWTKQNHKAREKSRLLYGDRSNGAKTHCVRGHPLSGVNLYINPASGARVCRTCIRDARAERKRSA